jgi:hypothetical protein
VIEKKPKIAIDPYTGYDAIENSGEVVVELRTPESIPELPRTYQRIAVFVDKLPDEPAIPAVPPTAPPTAVPIAQTFQDDSGADVSIAAPDANIRMDSTGLVVLTVTGNTFTMWIMTDNLTAPVSKKAAERLGKEMAEKMQGIDKQRIEIHEAKTDKSHGAQVFASTGLTATLNLPSASGDQAAIEIEVTDPSLLSDGVPVPVSLTLVNGSGTDSVTLTFDLIPYAYSAGAPEVPAVTYPILDGIEMDKTEAAAADIIQLSEVADFTGTCFFYTMPEAGADFDTEFQSVIIEAICRARTLIFVSGNPSNTARAFDWSGYRCMRWVTVTDPADYADTSFHQWLSRTNNGGFIDMDKQGQLLWIVSLYLQNLRQYRSLMQYIKDSFRGVLSKTKNTELFNKGFSSFFKATDMTWAHNFQLGRDFAPAVMVDYKVDYDFRLAMVNAARETIHFNKQGQLAIKGVANSILGINKDLGLVDEIVSVEVVPYKDQQADDRRDTIWRSVKMRYRAMRLLREVEAELIQEI